MRFLASARIAFWGPVMLALLMVALTLIPAEFWKAPTVDASYAGFDSNLIAVTADSPDSVVISNSSMSLVTTPQSQPSVNLATTQLAKLNVSVDVVIVANGGALQPFRIGVWSPWTNSGQFIVFGPGPQNVIVSESISNGRPAASLIGGDISDSRILGRYQVGNAYHVALSVDRSARSIKANVSSSDGTSGESTVGSTQLASLFTNVQLSLNASAVAGQGTSHVVLRNYVLTLPHQRSWTSKVTDPIALTVLIALAVLGGLALVRGIARGFPRSLRPPRLPRGARSMAPIAAAVAVYLIGNFLLFPLGGHPFDMGGERLWSYVAATYGPGQLYYLPNVVSLTWIWHGAPYIQSSFPYEPVSAYLSLVVGWLSKLLSGDWGFGPGNNVLEYLIKGANVLFGLADAALIYVIARTLAMSQKAALLISGVFLFNPAVWFSMSVWGQTHVFSLFFVLAAVLFAEKDRPVLAWSALAAACLTRPQMLVFGLLLVLVFMRRFSWRQNLAGVSWAVIGGFVILIPFTLATSPSLAVDVLRQNLSVQEAGANVASLTTVSQDGMSIWPLVTYAVHGSSGLVRSFTPSSETVVAGLTYQALGQVLTICALLLVSAALLLRRRVAFEGGAYLPLVALGISLFLMLLTGVLATHFLLALPFILLSYRWMGAVAFAYIATIWTVTTFVPMYGDMAGLISGLDYPSLSPAHNPVSKFFLDLYASDRFITTAVVANIAALSWLAYSTLSSSPGGKVATGTAKA